MSRFTEWFRTFSPAGRSSAHKSKRRDPVRLAVESLEDRSVPTVMFLPHAGVTQADPPGAYLANQSLYLVYWGPSKFWTQTKMDQYTNAVRKLTVSGYLDGVTQYGSDGKVTLFSTSTLLDTNPLPSQVDNDAVEDQMDLLNQQNLLNYQTPLSFPGPCMCSSPPRLTRATPGRKTSAQTPLAIIGPVTIPV